MMSLCDPRLFSGLARYAKVQSPLLTMFICFQRFEVSSGDLQALHITIRY